MDEIFKLSVGFMTRNSVTFTLSPPHKQWDDDSYRTMWADIILNAFDSCSDFIIIPELSDEDRLHFHGVLKFFCNGHKETYFDKRFRAQKVLRKYGSIEHSSWPKKQWIDYMWKDWIKTKESLPGIGIIRKHKNIECPDDWNIKDKDELEDTEIYHLIDTIEKLHDPSLNLKYNVDEIDWDLDLYKNIKSKEIDWDEIYKEVNSIH